MPEQEALFEPERTFGVGEVVARVSRVVSSALPGEIWVRGEVSGLKRPNQGGHVFFDLCERNNRRGPTSTLPAALFRADRERVEQALAQWPEFRLADGLEVRVKGRVQYAYGRVQLVISALDPVHTLGRLAADRQRVLRSLAADGVLGAQRSLSLPLVPLRLGLVTSAGSAAYEDVIHELTASSIGFRVLVADARVQGNGAELSMVRALHSLRLAGCDVVLLVRGGGSRTDLVAFDGERLARAVAAMPVPVLTGVGHEIDTCVVDEVAHAALKTPTACAAAVVAQARRGIAAAESAWAGVARRATASLDRADARLAAAGALLTPARLGPLLDRADDRLREAGRRVARAATASLDRQAARLDVADAHRAAADPDRALARGWSLTRRSDGSLVRRRAELAAGDVLVTHLADGAVRSVVTADA